MTTQKGLPGETRYQVLVAGGGPAGAAAATVLAQRGHSVLLAERSAEPQFKVGESLMPAAYWTLERLGALCKMKESRFVDKESVQFFTSSGRGATPFYFADFDSHESSSSWQVVRKEFDQLLLENGAEAGVEVRRGLAVKEVRFDGDRVVGAVVEDRAGQTAKLDVQVLIDATGQSTFLSRKLGLRQEESQLKNVAFFAHFDNGERGEGRDEGATLILHTEDKQSWFWYIPLPDNQVSVGVVGSVDYLIQGRSGDPQAVFQQELERCPAVKSRLVAATQHMPVKVQRDFSYRSKQISGDGWVLAGDAHGFIDPIYSTGVFLALKSGEMAGDAVADAFAENDLSGASLGRFGEEYIAGVDALKRLVYAFYDEGFSFADFLKRYPECREQLVHMLVGNVYRESVADILAALEKEEVGREPIMAKAAG